MRRLITVFTVSLIISVVGISAASATAPKPKAPAYVYTGPSLTLSLGAGFAQATNNGEGVVLLKGEIQKLSKGKVQVQAHYGDLGADLQLAQGVQQGTVDMGFVRPAVLSNSYPSLGVLDLPFVFKDYTHVYKVLDGPIGKGLFTGLSNYGIVGLSYSDLGWRNFVTKAHPVQSIADLKGLKMRSLQSPLFLTMWQDLGVTPVALAATDLYPALQNGTVDGLDMPVGYMVSAKLYEVTKYYSITHHSLTAMAFIINKSKWNSLPTSVQQLVTRAAKIAALAHRKYDRNLEAYGLGQLRAGGMQINTITASPMAAIIQAIQSVYAQAPNAAKIPAALIAQVRKVGGTS